MEVFIFFQSSQASDMLWFLTARILLRESQVMLFCRRTLCAIVDKPRSVEAVEVGSYNNKNFNCSARKGWCIIMYVCV